MIRERPTPPGTMDSTTVNEVNSYCAASGLALSVRKAIESAKTEILEVQVVCVMRKDFAATMSFEGTNYAKTRENSHKYIRNKDLRRAETDTIAGSQWACLRLSNCT